MIYEIEEWGKTGSRAIWFYDWKNRIEMAAIWPEGWSAPTREEMVLLVEAYLKARRRISFKRRYELYFYERDICRIIPNARARQLAHVLS